MGVSFVVYVGPYLACDEPITREHIDYCAEHGRGDAAFCPVCGSAMRYSTRIGYPSSNYWHASDDRLVAIDSLDCIDEQRQRSVAISNRCAFGLSLSRDDEAGIADVPDAAESIAAFEAEHASDIVQLRALGVTCVVKFGVLNYYM